MKTSEQRLQKLLLRKITLENSMISLHGEIERFEREVRRPNLYFHKSEYESYIDFKKGTLDEVREEYQEILKEINKAKESFTESLAPHFEVVDASTPQVYEGVAVKMSFIDEEDTRNTFLLN